MTNNPYTYLNERNAIILNCNDSTNFEEYYKQTLEKHFKSKRMKKMINEEPVLKLQRKDKDIMSSALA